MNIYLSSAYLAPVQYYSKLAMNQPVLIEQYDNYIKQTYRNRCFIVSANGPIALSIPVVHSSSQKVLMKDICIADHGNWQHIHWNAIISAYNSTPFFEYYQDDFYPFYHTKYKYLFDFNEELRQLILKLLNMDLPEVEYTTEYKAEIGDHETDYRDIIHPKKDWKILDKDYISVPYYQVFEQKYGFVDNMSIIDLLLNMGNESMLVLKESIAR